MKAADISDVSRLLYQYVEKVQYRKQLVKAGSFADNATGLTHPAHLILSRVDDDIKAAKHVLHTFGVTGIDEFVGERT